MESSFNLTRALLKPIPQTDARPQGPLSKPETRAKALGLLALLFILCALGCNGTGFTTATESVGGPNTPRVGGQAAGDRPLWEAKYPQSNLWTTVIMNQVMRDAPELIEGSTDIRTFCRYFEGLSLEEKAQFWAVFFSLVARYESNLEIDARRINRELGVDPVTRQQWVSEGLLQVGYGDTLTYSGCEFDFAADSQLPSRDLRRTILNPEKNLRCGVNIMKSQLARTRRIVNGGRNAYWKSLQSSGDESRVNAISTTTRSLSFCRTPPQ
jgi:hypothetical protein